MAIASGGTASFAILLVSVVAIAFALGWHFAPRDETPPPVHIRPPSGTAINRA